MERIYVVIAGSNNKSISSIQTFIQILGKRIELCEIDFIRCSTPEEVLNEVTIKSQHSKVIAIMIEDIIPTYKNTGLNSKVIKSSFEKTALRSFLDRQEFQTTVSSILIYDYPGLELDDKPVIYGNVSIVAGSFELIQKDNGWRQLISSVVKSIRRFVDRPSVYTHSSAKGEIIGQSSLMVNVFELIDKFAPTNASVLIGGESGTGKELVARQIHEQSTRKEGPFISVNCGAIPDGLIESELFGHEKGAFTGAVSMQIGCFETANGGTIFLDEIAELPKNQQVKLLRVLQEREISRVGSKKVSKIDVRVISATKKVINEMVKNGEFRDDLFYRLNVCRIDLPALRDRRVDIVPLALHFLTKYNANKDSPKSFEPDALRALEAYEWPGNVRELHNVVENAFIQSPSQQISVQVLSSILDSNNIDRPLKKDEKAEIQDLLIKFKGNKAEVLRALNIDRKTLDRRIKKYGIVIPK